MKIWDNKNDLFTIINTSLSRIVNCVCMCAYVRDSGVSGRVNYRPLPFVFQVFQLIPKLHLAIRVQ